jgi:ABC-type transporter Mla MlaB component
MAMPEENADHGAPRGGHVGSAGGGWQRVVLTGRLTVQEAGERRAEFLAMLGRAGRIELETGGLDAVDVAGIQALIAFRQSAERAGKAVRLARAPEGALRQALVAAGFSAAGPGGDAETAGDRFWLGEV